MLTTRMSPKMSEKPLATMNSSPANVSRVEQREDERAGVVERRTEVRRPPAVSDPRRRVGDHEHVEQSEEDRCSSDAKRDQLRARRLPEPLGHPASTTPMARAFAAAGVDGRRPHRPRGA